MTDFSPERVHVKKEHGRRRYDLTTVIRLEMAATLGALATVQSDIAFRKTDLAGYHHLQYGVCSSEIEKAIDEVLNPKTPERKKRQGFEELEALLPGILGGITRDARAERIVLGSVGAAIGLTLPETTGKYFDVVTEKSADGRDIRSLYPREESEFVYLGRSSLDPFRSVHQNRIAMKQFHSDSLSLNGADGPVSMTLLSEDIQGELYTPFRTLQIYELQH